MRAFSCLLMIIIAMSAEATTEYDQQIRVSELIEKFNITEDVSYLSQAMTRCAAIWLSIGELSTDISGMESTSLSATEFGHNAVATSVFIITRLKGYEGDAKAAVLRDLHHQVKLLSNVFAESRSRTGDNFRNTKFVADSASCKSEVAPLIEVFESYMAPN